MDPEKFSKMHRVFAKIRAKMEEHVAKGGGSPTIEAMAAKIRQRRGNIQTPKIVGGK